MSRLHSFVQELYNRQIANVYLYRVQLELFIIVDKWHFQTQSKSSAVNFISVSLHYYSLVFFFHFCFVCNHWKWPGFPWYAHKQTKWFVALRRLFDRDRWLWCIAMWTMRVLAHNLHAFFFYSFFNHDRNI